MVFALREAQPLRYLPLDLFVFGCRPGAVALRLHRFQRLASLLTALY